MERQDLKDTLVAWQWGEIGYRRALELSGLPDLFALYEAARRLDVPLRKTFTPRELEVAELATRDLLEGIEPPD